VYYLPTPVFFYGLKVDEEALVDLAPGKSILVKFIYMSEPDEDGMRHVFFKLNGQTRSIDVKDKKFKVTKKLNRKVTNSNEVGSPLQGKLSRILVKPNESVKKNTPLFSIEAMKMESTVVAARNGKIQEILLNEGSLVEQDDVVLVIAKEGL
jgi:pyruvate carboxylase